MNFSEKQLYNQIHPAKLFTDSSAAFASFYLLWKHKLPLALAVAFIPSIIASALLIRFADLEQYKHSAFGRYIHEYMKPSMEAVRFLGYVVAAVAAWYHKWLGIPIGLGITLLGWLRGKLFPK
jgi:hypothetical protein